MNPELLSDLRRRLEDAGLSAYAQALLSQARPAVDLLLDGVSEGEFGECRFGGAPDLPPSIEWPRDEEGRAFTFLLQLNLAQAPRFESSPLPESGMLWLFLGLDEPATDIAHRLILWQGDEELSPAAAPAEDELIDDAYAGMPPLRLRLEERADLPHWATDDFEALAEEMSEDEQEVFHTLWRGAQESVGQMLGHARGIGTDPRHDAFVVRDVNSAWLYDYKQRAALDMSRSYVWQNLLCLFSFRSAGVDFCVWDAGYLNFLIRRDDLQKLDFSRVYAAVESS